MISGRCRYCGCTMNTPCTIGETARGTSIECSWLDPAGTICDAPRCVAQVCTADLERIAREYLALERR